MSYQTVDDVISALEKIPGNTEVKIIFQSNYPLSASIRDIEVSNKGVAVIALDASTEDYATTDESNAVGW